MDIGAKATYAQPPIMMDRKITLECVLKPGKYNLPGFIEIKQGQSLPVIR